MTRVLGADVLSHLDCTGGDVPVPRLLGLFVCVRALC